MKNRNVVLSFLFLGGSIAVTGCSGLDRMSSKMDMVMGNQQATGQIAYEGQLETSRHVGSMIALQFKGGQYYDVSRASGALFPGDVVRVYATSTGYEAHLWHSGQERI